MMLASACGEGMDPSSPGAQEGQSDSQAVRSGPDGFVPGSRVHKMPVQASNSAAINTATSAHLTYYGGHVISNVKVYQVLYGSGTYFSQVQNTSTPSLATFYGQVTNSGYMDWLTEYNTNITAANGSQGTNQTIGRGTFNGQYTITPSSSNDGSTIDDTQIQAEINAQINAGHLPAPDANTIYMVNFPNGKTITQGGSSSCVSGGFCAYHGTFTRNGSSVYYGVLPDMSAGSGCDTGCGSSTQFNNQTSVASHELIEAVTDAEVGLSSTVGPPLAWYDSTNGEIGDICNAQQGSITGSDGVAYTVQKEWSNTDNACIVQHTTTSNDFSISASPNSLSLVQSTSGSVTISTATTSGSSQTVSFSVSGVPSGASASFSPTSVTSGSSSTLSINAGSAAAGTYTLTVTGTGSTATHTTAVTLTVTSSGGGGGGSGITNGGFETGSLSGWTTAAGTASAVTGGHSGSYSARVGSTGPTNGDSSITQTFTAPSGTTGLTFFYKVVCPDSVTYDWATATLKDNTAGTTSTVLAKTCTNSGSWVQANASITAGHSYTLTLTSHDDNYSGDATYTQYDDVALTSSSGGGGGSGVTNGGFETGSLSGWTSSGAHTAISTTAYSGSYSALVGNTSATNGDSSLSQTFTAPSGVSTLSLYYANNCPDSVSYDWATVTLKDNTSGTTTTVLPKTCAASYSWTNVTASVTAGHSYTLTLTNHDDNYSGDATYTLYDNVTLQ